MSELREKIMNITESISFEQIAEGGGLNQREEDIKKLKEECSAKIETLLKLER